MEAGRRYGIPWQVLAAINAIESDYGRDLSTSSAGAIGWMQFMPATWKQYGVAADGHSVPNPVRPPRRDLLGRPLPRRRRRRRRTSNARCSPTTMPPGTSTR